MNLLDGADPQPDEREALAAKWTDKSKEDVIAAKVESDLYIKTLEKQKDELRDDYLKQREELLAKAKFEELLDRYENSNKLPDAEPKAKEVVESPKFDPMEIETIVRKELQETRIREKQESNFNAVQAKLKEHFGEHFRDALKGTGLSGDRITEIAMESPEAVYRLVGITENKRENFQAPPRSNQRNDTFAPRGQTKRDYAFYQELKKSSPKMYLDPKIAVQMHNDVIEMGEAAFYGPN